MNVAVVLLSPAEDTLSRIKAVLSVSKVLPGLSYADFKVVENTTMAQLLNPVYAAVATPKALSSLSTEASAMSKDYDKVIFLKGENDPGIVEHSLLHELGHVSYQTLYPARVKSRQVFYRSLRDAMNKSGKFSYVMEKVYKIVETNPKARVLLTLESDELYANRFAYANNTDRGAYSLLANRELQLAMRAWGSLGPSRQFDAAFHMVLVDLYMRLTQTSWTQNIPYTLKWLLPYSAAVVDAVDMEDPVKLFARQVLLFNAVYQWADLLEEEVVGAIAPSPMVS